MTEPPNAGAPPEPTAPPASDYPFPETGRSMNQLRLDKAVKRGLSPATAFSVVACYKAGHINNGELVSLLGLSDVETALRWLDLWTLRADVRLGGFAESILDGRARFTGSEEEPAEVIGTCLRMKRNARQAEQAIARLFRDELLADGVKPGDETLDDVLGSIEALDHEIEEVKAAIETHYRSLSESKAAGTIAEAEDKAG